MIVNNVTPNFGFELPDPRNELQDDVLRLANALQAIDAAIQTATSSISSLSSSLSALVNGATTPYTTLAGVEGVVQSLSSNLSSAQSSLSSQIEAVSASLSSYAPLTGAGASGTWPISVTGNAGSVTGIASLILADFIDLNTIIESGFYRVDNAPVNAPYSGASWGTLLVIHAGSDTITQIYGDYSTGALWTRSGAPPNTGGNKNWSAWFRLATLDDVAEEAARAEAAEATLLPLSGGTLTGTLTLPGTSSVIASLVANIAEPTQIIGAAPAANQTLNIFGGSVAYFTTAAANNWTLNLTFSSGTTLNSVLTVGQSITCAVLVTQGVTAYYSSAVNVDGAAVTPYWQGGSAPTSGNASGIDVYTYTIIKTANATFTVLASLTQF